ncbi:hypothetical protein CSB89_1768 [Pseudomonas aeruginosa]|nr:hypothetical protein CSC44_4938 [Pseudomonas aeruginosa]RCG92677.1 hypothetical protein CSB89_1768 [Pseudomonas aeruginosa]
MTFNSTRRKSGKRLTEYSASKIDKKQKANMIIVETMIEEKIKGR